MLDSWIVLDWEVGVYAAGISFILYGFFAWLFRKDRLFFWAILFSMLGGSLLGVRSFLDNPSKYMRHELHDAQSESYRDYSGYDELGHFVHQYFHSALLFSHVPFSSLNSFLFQGRGAGQLFQSFIGGSGMSWTAYDHRQVQRFLETPHICRKWHGVCDGLPEFSPSAHIYQNGKVLFTGSIARAESYLAQLLSQVPSADKSTELTEMGCA